MDQTDNQDVDMQDVTGSNRLTPGVLNDVTLAPAFGTVNTKDIFQEVSYTSTGETSSPHVPLFNQNSLVLNTNNGLQVDSRSLSDYPKSKKTGIVYNVQMMLHAPINYSRDGEPDNSIGDDLDDFRSSHPEEPRRISHIYAKLKAANLVSQMIHLPCPEATPEQALLVHTDTVWNEIEKTSSMSHQRIREEWPAYERDSLYINNQTALASRLSCGGVISACEAVVRGVVRNAIAVVRPPGHHAEPDKSLGFCFLNNVAVAAKTVRREHGVKKIMIVDWDVHHGNGTQRAFYDDPNVLYVSIHRHDGGRFYPCSDFGALDVTGEGAGEGKTVNIPWPQAGFGDGDYFYAFQEVIMPIGYEFAPDLVIISAGFDAAEGDELGECKVTPGAYAQMTHMLMGLAGGKVVVALEGGYNLEAISNSAEAVARALTGDVLDLMPPMRPTQLGNETVYQVVKMQAQYWQCLRGKRSAPLDVLKESEEDSVDLRDVLKHYRAHRLCEKHKMFVVPLANPDLDRLFPDQVLTDRNLFSAKTVVLFVHDFGNFWHEPQNTSIMDGDFEKSRLVEQSNKVIEWMKEKEFSVIDVNTTAAFPVYRSQMPPTREKWVTKQAPRPWIQLMKYIWDNYLSLLDCENIILFGFGTGCDSIMSLVNTREIETKVATVIQVGGMNTLVRPDPTNDDRRAWFREHSRLYLPADHPVLEDSKLRMRLRTQIEETAGISPLDVLPAALPGIKTYVDQCLKDRASGALPTALPAALNLGVPR